MTGFVVQGHLYVIYLFIFYLNCHLHSKILSSSKEVFCKESVLTMINSPYHFLTWFLRTFSSLLYNILRPEIIPVENHYPLKVGILVNGVKSFYSVHVYRLRGGLLFWSGVKGRALTSAWPKTAGAEIRADSPSLGKHGQSRQESGGVWQRHRGECDCGAHTARFGLADALFRGCVGFNDRLQETDAAEQEVIW